MQPKQRAKAMPRKQSPQGKGSAQKRGRKPAAVAPAVAAAAAAAAEPLPLPLPKAKKNGGAGAAAAAVAPAEPGAFSVPPLLASEFPDHVTAMDKLVKEVNKAVARARRHAAKAGGRGVPCVLGGDSGNYKGSETHGVWVSHDGLVKAEGQWEKVTSPPAMRGAYYLFNHHFAHPAPPFFTVATRRLSSLFTVQRQGPPSPRVGVAVVRAGRPCRLENRHQMFWGAR